ncbi:MAG: thioredoxin domain-containing protein [Candidatus Micrarchaeia archaeon]
MAKIIKGSEFDDEVINSAKPVLVDFFATWCPPCRALSPIIDEISESGLIKVVKSMRPRMWQRNTGYSAFLHLLYSRLEGL